MVRQRSAKPLFTGSIPVLASKLFIFRQAPHHFGVGAGGQNRYAPRRSGAVASIKFRSFRDFSFTPKPALKIKLTKKQNVVRF